MLRHWHARTAIERDQRTGGPLVGGVGIPLARPGLLKDERVEERLLLDLRQDHRAPERLASIESRREGRMRVVIVVHGDPEVFQVIAAGKAAGGFAGLLDGRQQQGEQHADQGDHDEELDQRETSGTWAPR
jgi:hypothetical protein